MTTGETAAPDLMPKPEGHLPAFAAEDGRFVLYKADCLQIMPLFPGASFDMVFADPPYFLSSGGITCHAGKMGSGHTGDCRARQGPPRLTPRLNHNCTIEQTGFDIPMALCWDGSSHSRETTRSCC